MNKKTKIIFLAIIILGLFGWAGKARAVTYYVRTDGNNNCAGTTDAAGSSGACAFRTILKGIQTAQAGDTVTVHTGNYTSETLASIRSGSSGNLVTIKAATGETASIGRITITHDYHVVRGFTITNPGNLGSTAGIAFTGDYDQALNNTMYATCNPYVDGEGVCVGIYMAGSNNVVSYNTLDGQNNNQNKAFGIGFSLGTSSSYNEISYNTFKDSSSPGRVFEIWGNNQTIKNNEIRNLQGGSSAATHVDVFQTWGTTPATNINIEENYIHDINGQLGNFGVDGNYSSWTGWVFRNNIFANISAELFLYISVEFYNNTFYRVTTINTGWPLYPCYGDGKVTSKNNAFIACGTGTNSGWWNDCQGSTGDYDFVSNTATGGAKNGFSETNGINGGNPLLTAVYDNCTANVCDFTPQVGSPLIDNGVTVAGYTTDYAGNTRSGTWDIGAYEYVSGGGDTTAPAAPQGLTVN